MPHRANCCSTAAVQLGVRVMANRSALCCVCFYSVIATANRSIRVTWTLGPARTHFFSG